MSEPRAPYVPLLLILSVVAFILRIDLLFSITWMVVGLYVCFRLWTFYSVRSLTVSRRFDDRAFPGDDIHVTLVILNSGRLPIPFVEIAENLPIQLRGGLTPAHVCTLAAREERRFTYSWRCEERGQYSPGPLSIRVRDLLGMRQRALTVAEPRAVTVYPRVESLQHLHLPTHSPLAVLPARTPLFEDTSRVIGTRAYQVGDSPRRVHWTASARTGGLMVKRFEPAIARDTLLCLDLTFENYLWHRFNAVAKAIVVAASLAKHMVVREDLPVGLIAEGRASSWAAASRFSLPPRRGSAQLISVLETLAHIHPTTNGSFVNLVRQAGAGLAWGATMTLITGHVGTELAETVFSLQRGGRSVSVIQVQPRSAREIGGRHATIPGVRIYHVWTDVDLRQCV